MEVRSGESFILEAGERVTIVPGVYHAFWPESPEVIIGEVSTANDDAHDNFFVDPNIGRFPEIDEDEPPVARLVWEKSKIASPCPRFLVAEFLWPATGWWTR